MDLAIGAKRTFVMMEHQTKDGQPKLVPACSYPLTASRCVSRVYTDLAVIEFAAGRAVVLARCPGLDMATLQARTGFALASGDA